MKSKEKNTKKALNVRVDAEAFQNLKMLCVERNISLANVLDGYLRELQKQRLMGSKYVDNLIFD